jgi:hypothetical protein
MTAIRATLLPVCLLLLAVALQSGCATTGPAADTASATEQRRQNIAGLEQAILALGDEVDPEEASRTARIAIEYSREQALEYEVTGSPIMHNVLVNLGIKSRGLCKDWTRDLLVRLRDEDLQSLEFNWAIANYDRAFQIEHSTVIVSARGDGIEKGIVLDGWRNSGDLFWASTLEDTDYPWRPAKEIYALKQQVEDDDRDSTRIR